MSVPDLADLSSATWRKSSFSGMNGCVEVAFVEDLVAVRNTRERDGMVVIFNQLEWEAFVLGVRDGEFDLPVEPATV